jgi:GTP-binding protein EngB required for normal cell division
VQEAFENATRLPELERLAAEAGVARLAAEVRALSERVREGLFYVACVGQFKRGKSSLLNALIGRSVLPVGVAPVTAVVTVVRHGEHSTARVRFDSGAQEETAIEGLGAYVTEEENPENRKGVAAVEVFVPSELLATGMCLVDTPGIGSVFGGNTEVTRSFVPHVDAALVVIGADPPLSADELALVEEIAKQCRDLIFVLNKADRLGEADREEAVRFTRRVLAERAGLKDVRLFEVSAAERLEGRGPERGWHGLTDALGALARRSGSRLVRSAAERGLARIAARLRLHLEEERGALLRPASESEHRVDALRGCVAEAERSLNDVDYLFLAEQERLARDFAGRKATFLGEVIPAAQREMAEACRSHPARRGPALRKASVAQAQEIATRHLDAWLAETEPAAEIEYTRAMERFVDLSNGFLQRLKASADSMLAALPSFVNPEVGFRWDSKLFYRDLWQMTGEGPLTWILDCVRSRSRIVRSIDRATGDYLRRLLDTNATRIENDLNQRVLESRRRFQFEIRALLREVLDSASGSLDRAKRLHAQGSEAVRGEVERLDALLARLEALGVEAASDASSA